MGEYDKVVADCDAAVERGRELRADYKMVARALTRKGNALVKKGDLPAAIDTFHKSLTEHRCRHLNESLHFVPNPIKLISHNRQHCASLSVKGSPSE